MLYRFKKFMVKGSCNFFIKSVLLAVVDVSGLVTQEVLLVT